MALPLVLAACATQASDEIARAAARRAVDQVLVTRFPGVPVAPVTDCVIDNASASEIVAVAADSATGTPSATTVRVVTDVLARPETLTCLGTNALPILLT